MAYEYNYIDPITKERISNTFEDVNIIGADISNGLTILPTNTFANSKIKRVCACGDSITANGFSKSATAKAYEKRGYTTWIGELSQQKIIITHETAFALSGITTRRWIDEGYLPQALSVSDRVDAYSVLLGTNDIAAINGTTITMDTIKADYLEMINALSVTGKIIAVIPVLPRVNSMTAQRYKQHSEFTRFIHSLCASRSNLVLVDCTRELINTTTTTDDVLSGAYYDSPALHPSAKGAAIIAAKWISVMTPYIYDSTPYSTSRAGDLFDATDNPYGNFMPNGLMTGTGGSLSGGLPTGQLADNYSLSVAANGTASVTCSKVARSDISGTGFWQQVAISGTPATNLTIQFNPASAPTGYSAGDRIELTCDYELDSGHTNLAGFALYSPDTPSAYTSFCHTVTASDAIEYRSDIMLKGTLRTPEYIIPQGGTPSFRLALIFPAGAASAATFRFGNISLRRVAPTQNI